MADWNQRFLDLSFHVAGWSKDPSTQVGAVIVNEHKQVLSMGYNGFPRGVSDSPIRYADRDTKLMFVAHAERNALDNAYMDVRGATLYSTLCPCNECAKSIIQRGIRKVVSKKYDDEYSKRFNFDVTKQMFAETAIELVFV
jgi:dCMP deaminase